MFPATFLSPRALCARGQEIRLAPSPISRELQALATSQPGCEEQDSKFSLEKTPPLWRKSINSAPACPISSLTTCSSCGKKCKRKCFRNQKGNSSWVMPYNRGCGRTKAAQGAFLWALQGFPWGIFLLWVYRSRNICWAGCSLYEAK